MSPGPNGTHTFEAMAFRLDGTTPAPAKANVSPFRLPKPWRPRQSPELVAGGARVYDDNGCLLCHGVGAIQAGREIPDLRASSENTYAAMRDIFNGAFRQAGMPAFKNITDQQIIALQAYLTEQAWTGYEIQEKKVSK